MKHIVCFSGGKDSTAMLLGMLERGMPVDYIVYVDTGKDFPQMYKHIDKVENYIGRKINRLQFRESFDYWLGEHIKTRGKNKGKKGYGWPNPLIRWCTGLKKETVQRFHKQINDEYVDYVGIAYDERQRAKDKIYPMINWKMTEAQALQFCYNRGFNWDGLYEHFHRVSCYCCPLKSLDEQREIYKCFPELWKDMQAMDGKAYNKFRKDYTLEELTKRFEQECNQ